MLVAVFDNEKAAFEGQSALKDLHKKGDITLYASAVVSKDENGSVHLKSAAEAGASGLATGLFAGSLIGLLGGPIGLAVGASTGAIAGLIFDASKDDINVTFGDEVSRALTNGKTAVIAEIDETWTVPVDTSLDAVNAMIFRRLKYEVAEEQLRRESEAIEAEYQSLKEELEEAKEEDKVVIKASIDKLQNKAEVLSGQINRKVKENKDQLEAKVNKLREQMKDAREKRKGKIERRINEVKEEFGVRAENLKQASKLVGEALEGKRVEELIA